ncbi:ABC transporter permease [Labrys monachus]|uniref:Spermidine/putrescine transport system permease protein n=1 Tax=Labrys monachus TaxID=217067 RepID=A0ABU0F881_9HYPH|nr:acriflavin resistance protein [Labrys monachus]MDQ0390821.1 putative spermidine/putrescine transport system permease protein [Labrys monachus]
MTTTVLTTAPPAKARSAGTGFFSWAMLGMTPFVAFSLLFLILPTALLLVRAFEDQTGAFTFGNIGELFLNERIRGEFLFSIEVSAASAVSGAFCGFFLAYAVVLGGLPSWLRSPVLTFSGVASNFAGVPLAFAFIATIGPVGLITMMLRQNLGVNINVGGIILYKSTGLTLVYLYFQIPLMVLVIVPALDGLKREWREATSVLGGTNYHYWRYVALPVLWPSVLGATLLLFANSFGAIATAYSLSARFPIIPIELYAQIRGDVLNDPGLGYAIAFGMVVITSITSGAYIWLRSRSERWLR